MTKKCPPDKILNPLTNRCVLRRGLIGKKLLNSQSLVLKSPIIKSPIIKSPNLKYIKRRNQINNSFREFIDPNIPNLDFTDIETNYISNPKFCKWRNKWLIKHTDIYHICDAYACIGGDTIQFMKLKPNIRIDAIQITNNDKELIERFNRLKANIKKCSFLNSKVKTHSTSIVDFIFDGKCEKVDFFYCDPPWADPFGYLYNCLELMANLTTDIIIPLIKVKHFPKYICFKVPFHWNEFKEIMNNLPNYHLQNSGSFYWNNYWMHIIKKNKK